jgi:protease I
MISANQFEDTELLVPLYRLKESGITVDIASIRRGEIAGKHGYKVEANRSVDEVSSRDYDMLVLPGGKAPAKLRKNDRVLELAREFMASGKTVAAICHGPQVLISANVVKGRRMTCAQGVAGELKDAGAAYEHQSAVVDGNLITSREPADLPAFNREIMERMGSAAQGVAA